MTNDEVGFGKPPKHTRFKPGESGNLAGRPRGRVSTSQLLLQYVYEKVTYMVGSKKKTISRREALIRSVVSDALKGKEKVRKETLDLVLTLEAKMSHEPVNTVSGVEDEAVITSLLQLHGVKAPFPSVSPSPPKAPVKIKIVKSKKNEVVK